MKKTVFVLSTFLVATFIGLSAYWGPELYQDWKFVHQVRVQAQLQDAATTLIKQAQAQHDAQQGQPAK